MLVLIGSDYIGRIPSGQRVWHLPLLLHDQLQTHTAAAHVLVEPLDHTMADDDTGIGMPCEPPDGCCARSGVCIYADVAVFDYTKSSETQRKNLTRLTPKVSLPVVKKKR